MTALAKMRRVAVSPGVAVAVDVWPGGDVPVVLVHGLASNARLWDGMAHRLVAAGHAVASVDLRGHGRSDKPADGYDFATIVSDLLAVFTDLGFDRPIVAGQSWGGNVVLELAARGSRALRAAVLVDGGWIDLSARFPDWEECARTLSPPNLEGTRAAEVEAYLRREHPDWPESGIAGTMANFDVRSDGTVRPWLPRDQHLQILRHLWEHRPRDRYPEIGVPVVLVPAGNADDPAVVEAASAIPRARVRAFPGADHDVHAQHPDALAGVVLDALADGFIE